MYFKKLELVGFKSFLEKTTLHFEPGITAIVGPNGCGKSNIFDSIRWVLGEQSVKALRGSEMQDIIFNGTDVKEPLSMAEVTLIFDNSNQFFNLENSEVAVTRRIFRSGESEYLLNKTQVRLKDILDLLVGTGIGAESYSLVEQGKIDLVLSSRPEDRRLVFDEAAGITKYKQQKKEAMRKLDETEQNLLRINDIISEVKRQIGSLERQANKARKYKEVFEELKSKEISSAILQKNNFLKEKDGIIDQLKELEAKEIELLNIINAQEAKIANRQAELKVLEENIMGIKDEILGQQNLILRDKERINLNRERTIELDATQKYLAAQIEQTKTRLVLDEEKLNKVKQEFEGIKKNIDDKSVLLRIKQNELDSLGLCVKSSLDYIAKTKKNILEMVVKIAGLKNELADSNSRQQIYLARKKRLEIEKAKVNEEKAATENNLNGIREDLATFKKNFLDLQSKISQIKAESEQKSLSLSQINSEIENLEKEVLALQSQKEFLGQLKTKYDDISESMNATIYLDKLPRNKINGLVVKIKELETATLKATGEARPFDLDTTRISERMNEIQQNLATLKDDKLKQEAHIEELKGLMLQHEVSLRNQEIALANKKAFEETILEQFNKIKEEEDIILLELSDVAQELEVLSEKLNQRQSHLSGLEKEQGQFEDSMLKEQNSITLNSNLKEEILITITQTKTEIEALTRRIGSDEATLKILHDSYNQDKESLLNLERLGREAKDKQDSLILEIKELEDKIIAAHKNLENQNVSLKEAQDKYKEISDGAGDIIKKIDSGRKELDNLKNTLYELQMHNKDVEFKIISIRDRVLQAYKIDLDTTSEVSWQIGESNLSEDIQRLKEKLDSYGTVNLVAIEEYDELKKRYDFLTQQQNDLIQAKESLHEAILKINRTTKKMFVETFEKIRQEFRNYFRMLFNGGDAQLFLIDEQDPLESGIEIICRPPGKKLQNVLLLSGGEKSLSAIALIFAIFKVKPSPFCILDEIDAALDEANVDRFSRILQEFARSSQFIVITHNKRTIANADVMYGITMEQSGVSKIVSVKFAKGKELSKHKQPNEPVAEPV